MTTMADIVTRAHRKLGVIGRGDPLQAEEAREGIDALNAMMHAWKLRGVDIEHSDLALTADFPLAPEYVEGTIYLLAARLSPDFAIPPSFDADDWFRGMQAAYLTLPEVEVPTELSQMPSAAIWGRGALF